MHEYIHITNWFEKWFDHNYLKLYQHRNIKDAREQVRLIIKTLHPGKNDSILDLACGEGRHCMLFHKKGYTIKGIDLSTQLINSGKTKHPYLNLHVGDMRRIRGKHDIILSLFTSFGYFERDQDNLSVIRSISHALNADGWFWLDFLNPEYIKKNLVPDSKIILKDGTKIIEKRFIKNNTIVKVIVFNGSEIDSRYQERVKLYTKEDLEKMMRESGIEPCGAFGNYKGKSWTPDLPRTIIYGRKESE